MGLDSNVPRLDVTCAPTISSVGFFASRPRSVRTGEPIEPRFSQPEWIAPPRGVLGGYASTRAVIFHTDRAVLVASRFDAYLTGVEFTLELQLRESAIDYRDFPWELHLQRNDPRTELPAEFLRLGVRFSDGSSWSNFDAHSTPGWAAYGSPTARPDGPILVGRGGGGDEGGWRMNQWLWPLPPEGPLTFFAEWPAFDVPETAVVVDASELRRAAERSELLWST